MEYRFAYLSERKKCRYHPLLRQFAETAKILPKNAEKKFDLLCIPLLDNSTFGKTPKQVPVYKVGWVNFIAQI